MFAAIMAGGEGTRLWPASREACPKQFLSILGGEPLLVQTMKRLEGVLPLENVLVLVNRKHQDVARRLVGDQAYSYFAQPYPFVRVKADWKRAICVVGVLADGAR